MVFQIILLTLAMAIWGLAYVAIKVALNDFTPLWMNGLRYLLAGLVLLPIFWINQTWKKSWKEISKPFFASLLLFLGIGLQTLGLKYTTVAKSGFITCLYVFLVPLYYSFGGKRFRKRFWGLVFSALVGVGMLCDFQFNNFNLGDTLTLLCVLFFSAHIVFISKVAKSYESAFEFNGLQCLFYGIVACLLAFFIEGPTSFAPFLDKNKWTYFSSTWAMFVLAIPSGVLAFAIQIHTQKSIPAYVVSLVFLLQSLFAAAFGYWILGEQISHLGLWGCVLITLAVGLVPFVEKKTSAKDK